LLFVALLIAANNGFAQDVKYNNPLLKQNVIKKNFTGLLDTTKPVTQKTQTLRRKVSLGGIFISAGTGLNVPLTQFYDNSTPTFGIIGRLEYSSYTIFPFVIGGEVTYFSYNGSDEFKTLNILSNYKTKILSFGLSFEYTLSKVLNSSYTIPFITIDVKSNSIKRDYDADSTLADLPRTDSKISVGAGFGFTLFVLDFYVKYNYMKNLSNFGVYTKIKIPIIRF